MPRDQKKKHEASRKVGGVKSSRRSGQTIANKARKAASRENRLTNASNRRLEAISFVTSESFKNLRGANRSNALTRAERATEQRERISKKRDSRRGRAKS